MNRSVSSSILVIATLVVVFTPLAFAGPPLLCHALKIGEAKTLPWVDLNFKKETGRYDLKNLTPDTLAILNSKVPVIVHMETIRRAALYARQDANVARELLSRLHARAAEADASGHPDALAWFDVGYLAEAYNQWFATDEPNPANGLNGYAIVKKAIVLRGQDPEMEFAAAMITLTTSSGEHTEHVHKAMSGAKADPLLAQNLSSNFNNESIAQLLGKK